MSQRPDIAPLIGGLDLTTPPVSVKSGRCLVAYNYEPRNGGGYNRIAGDERIDGRSAPSDAVYYTVEVGAIGSIAVGDTLTGDISGATSYVVAVSDTTLAVTNLSGNYTLSETANGQTITAIEKLNGASTNMVSQQWRALAQDYYRSLISAVPGSGGIRGIARHDGELYAFRDNAGATATVMYKATASGWSAVTFYHVLAFDAGTLSAELAEETVIDGGTSGAQGTVKKFIKQGGSYGSTAYGYMVVDVTTGTFQDNEAIEVSASSQATANGDSYAITLATGGKHEFISHNFFATADSYNLYGADGVNPAFEFDGTVYTPILLDTTADDVPSSNTPKFIEAHTGYLYLSFPNGVFQRSEPGLPLNWSAFLGAATIGVGSEITGLVSQPGGVLAIYTEREVYGLYGVASADLELKPISRMSGARPYTARLAGTIYSVDPRGISRLDRAQEFGDFEAATASRDIKPLLDIKADTVSVVGAILIRGKNQYRVFYNDGSGIIMGDDNYLGDELPAFTEFGLGRNPTALHSSTDLDGIERAYFGDDQGYVYQLERGPSFDGAEIISAIVPVYNHMGGPRTRKAFRRCDFDIESPGDISFSIATEIDFGEDEIGDVSSSPYVLGAGGQWNAVNWNEFYYGGKRYDTEGIYLTGSGTNLSVGLYHSSNYTYPFTIQTLYVYYINRRLARG